MSAPVLRRATTNAGCRDGGGRQGPNRGRGQAMTLFEQEHGRFLWRLEATQWNGQRRLQVWPWYQPKDGGDPRPCSPRYGGGFAIPLDRVPELIAALSSMVPDES